MELGVTAVMLPELDFDEQIDLCASLGIKYYQYRPRVIPDHARDKPYHSHGNHKFDLTPERLLDEGRDLTARLRARGLEPWGTVPGLNTDSSDEQVRHAVEAAVAADAKCVRCNPAPYPREPFDYPAFLDRVVQRYAYLTERISWPMGIKLIIETHANSLATSPALAWQIVKDFSPQRLGVIFDLPNFNREGGVNPILGVSVLRDYIDCVHFGASRRIEAEQRDEHGCRLVDTPFCPPEDSDLHLPTWLKALADAGVDAPIIIEDYDAELDGPARLARNARFVQNLGFADAPVQ